MSRRSVNAKPNGGYAADDLENDDDHSSIASSGDYSMKTPPLESILQRSSEGAVESNAKRDSTKRVRPRYHRNRLQKVVREYALKVIFAYKDEIHTDAGTFRPIPEPQRKALWDRIRLKIMHKYPSAVTTGDSLKSLWRTALWKIRRNKATFQEYVTRVDAGLTPDELPSFSDIEVQIYRWLRTTTAFEPTVYTDESWLSQTGLPVAIDTSSGGDVPLIRSYSSSSSISGDSVTMGDEDITRALQLNVQPQTSSFQPIIDPQTSINLGAIKLKKSKHWNKAERDTLIKLVIEHKDSLFDDSAACALSSLNGDRIEVWNRILTKFLEKYPSTKASTGSLKRLWRSCRDKLKDHGHEYARYLNGAIGPLPPGAASPLTEAEVDLYRWLMTKPQLSVPDVNGQLAATDALHNETPNADIMRLASTASWLLVQPNVASANVHDGNTLASNQVVTPTTQAFTTVPVDAPSSEHHSLQTVRFRLVQVLNHIRQLEGELRDISGAVQTISNAQQSSASQTNEMEQAKEENLRLKQENEKLRMENERLKIEKTEFLGSLSRYLSENGTTVGERTAVCGTSSSMSSSVAAHVDTRPPSIYGCTPVKEERT